MKLVRLTVIPPLDRYPRVVAFAQTHAGKAFVLALFGAGLALTGRVFWPEVLVILALMSWFPQHRRGLMLLATLLWAATYTWFDWPAMRDAAAKYGTLDRVDWTLVEPLMVTAVLIFCALLYQAVKLFPGTLVGRRPVASLLVIYAVLLMAVSYLPLSPLVSTWLWFFLIVLGRYLWFIAYLLIDRKGQQSEGFLWQTRNLVPFWAGLTTTVAPIPKVGAYLRRIEAKSDEELAVAQLKGIKLLYWAYVLQVVQTLFNNVVYGIPGMLEGYLHVPYTLNIPTFQEALDAALAGSPNPWWMNWITLVTSLLTNVIHIAIFGHVIIATARMAGFNALRGTYKPLYAKTLAEFWNRYFYYFKELLVEFFFYPAYLRYFKRRPQLRLFFATVMAAGFGNVVYHFYSDIEYIVAMGFWEALWSFHVYMFYGMVLGTAIGFSQLRNRRRNPADFSWLRRNVYAPATVIGFYCIVLIFDSPRRELDLLDYFTFVASLLPWPF